MKKQIMLIAFIALGSLTSCYDFNRRQNELDAESNGKATLLEAESSKKAKIEEAKANLESAKLDAQTKMIRAKADAEATIIRIEAKAKAVRTMSDAVRNNPDYLKYLMIDGMYNHGRTIYIPTEAGLPIIERK